MNIYKQVNRYNVNTGEVDGTWGKVDHQVCDYSGTVISNDLEFRPLYTLQFKYDTSCEPTWDDDSAEKQWFTKNLKDHYNAYGQYGEFLESEYHFWTDGSGQDQSTNFLDEWHKGFGKSASIFYRCLSLDAACRMIRMRTIKKLVAEKKYTFEQFISSL